MSSNPILSAYDLSKSFSTTEGTLTVLDRVSVDLYCGQSVALTGESGSGKSTLLHCLGCLDTPDSGSMTLRGQNMMHLEEAHRAAIRRNDISVIFQQLNLIPSLTVAQNMAFQARLSGRYDPDWLAELSRRLGLDALHHRYPEELSGGQQQRVAIGRAVAHRPAVVLADEPTGNLDESTADDVLKLLLELVRETSAALMMVTHSSALAGRLDRRLHLRQGHLT
jgi:putative ABC transport system ATP-binding protein